MQSEKETLKRQINYQIERNLKIIGEFRDKLSDKKLNQFSTMESSDSLFEAVANIKVYKLLLEEVDKGAFYCNLKTFCDKNALEVMRDGSRSTSETSNMSKRYLAKAWSNGCIYITG